MDVNSCFYLPKELITDEYREYSVESKLLFAMLITNSETASAIAETAKLIDELGVRKINAMHKSPEREIQKIKESERA